MHSPSFVRHKGEVSAIYDCGSTSTGSVTTSWSGSNCRALTHENAVLRRSLLCGHPPRYGDRSRGRPHPLAQPNAVPRRRRCSAPRPVAGRLRPSGDARRDRPPDARRPRPTLAAWSPGIRSGRGATISQCTPIGFATTGSPAAMYCKTFSPHLPRLQESSGSQVMPISASANSAASEAAATAEARHSPRAAARRSRLRPAIPGPADAPATAARCSPAHSRAGKVLFWPIHANLTAGPTRWWTARGVNGRLHAGGNQVDPSRLDVPRGRLSQITVAGDHDVGRMDRRRETGEVPPTSGMLSTETVALEQGVVDIVDQAPGKPTQEHDLPDGQAFALKDDHVGVADAAELPVRRSVWRTSGTTSRFNPRSARSWANGSIR